MIRVLSFYFYLNRIYFFLFRFFTIFILLLNKIKAENGKIFSMKEDLLDKIDQRLLELLAENGKLNNKELAEAVGLSVTPTFERVKCLERLGVITGYHAEINPKMVGKELKVLCQVSLRKHQFDDIVEFEKAIRELKEVSTAYHVTGSMDYMLTVEVANMDAYQSFLKNRLSRIPHIGQVNSSFVLSALK